MKKRYLLYIFFLFVLKGCTEAAPIGPEPAPDPTVGTAEESLFVIKRGNHSTNHPYKSVRTTGISFKAKLDGSAIYHTLDPENQADINKLLGIADCSTHHHTNSARFGWRWFGDQLQVWAYCYQNGQRMSKFIGNVLPEAYHTYTLEVLDTEYIFKLDLEEVKMARGCTGLAQGYMLYPYFGGDEPAPHDIYIWIKGLTP